MNIKDLELEKIKIEKIISKKQRMIDEFTKDHGDIKKSIFYEIRKYIADDTLVWNIVKKIFPKIGHYINGIQKQCVIVKNKNDVEWVHCGTKKPTKGKSVLTYCKRYGDTSSFEYIWNSWSDRFGWENTHDSFGGLVPLYWCYFDYPEAPAFDTWNR